MALLLTAPAAASNFEGFVTHIDSPTSFDLGPRHVVLAASTACVELNWRPRADGDPKAFSRPERTNVSCGALHLRIGADLRLRNVTPASGGLTPAECDKVNRLPGRPRPIAGTALLTETPHLHANGNTLTGEIELDGYKMKVTPETRWSSLPAGTTFAPFVQTDGQLRLWDTHGNIVKLPAAASVAADPVPQANMWVSYRGTVSVDGVIATSLTYWPNVSEAKADEYRQKHTAIVREPDYTTHQPGTIQFPNEPPIEIVPDQEIQSAVSRVATEMVVHMQAQDRGGGVPSIPFRFYVVHSFRASRKNDYEILDGKPAQCSIGDGGNVCTYTNPKPNAVVTEIVAMQDGLILVPDTQLASLQNQAQLAALLAYAIASVQQKDIYRLWLAETLVRHGWSLSSDRNGSSNVEYFNSFIDSLNTQVMRFGMEAVRRAGYDVAQAPYAWSAAAKKPGLLQKMFGRWLVQYGFDFLALRFPSLDYSTLREGSGPYTALLKHLRAADAGVFGTDQHSRSD